jgi:hypothetical protein
MTDLKHEIAVAMLRIQDLLEEAELGEHEDIQNAFNALASAFDYYIED